MKKVKKKVKFNKKVIIWSIIFFILGFVIAPSNTTVVEKEVTANCPKCKTANLEEAISLYKEILELDAEVFMISGEQVKLIQPAAEAGMTMDINALEAITKILQENTAKVNDIALQKYNLLLRIDSLVK